MLLSICASSSRLSLFSVDKMYNVVALSAATSSDHLDALAEVRDFAWTDMGRGPPYRYTYRILSEPQISDELQRLSTPFVRGAVSGVSFQPCPLPEFRSQDRSVTESWPTPSGSWTFNAVFDGHVGHTTVDYVAARLPSLVRNTLEQYLLTPQETFVSDIKNILSDSIVQFDNSISDDFIALFPGGLRNMSDEDVENVLQDSANCVKSLRCLHGCTALLSLSDPSREHVWIANLGDCQAVLASQHHDGHWVASEVSALHDGDNPAEVERIQREHPDESEACPGGRVIGWLSPTRSMGDSWLKLPAIYSQRALLFLRSEWLGENPEPLIARIQTPPYLSNIPDVRHISLSRQAAESQMQHVLLLCSDGLPDLYSSRLASRAEMAAHWAQVVGRAVEARSDNPALVLLRDALGGDDTRSVSAHLTVEMDERWMDDVTILVQPLSYQVSK